MKNPKRNPKLIGGLRISSDEVQRSKKIKGQYFTPKIIVKSLIIKLIPFINEFSTNSNISILDPAIGEGIFFKEILPFIKNCRNSIELHGIDIDPNMVQIAKSELRKLVDEPKINLSIINDNFLINSKTHINFRKYDFCIGNPPHNAKYSLKELNSIKNQEYFLNRPDILKRESSILFTLKSLALVKQGGYVFFILPKPIVYSKRWSEFRKILLREYQLLEVIDLGNQFSFQRQEQCCVLIRKENPITSFKTSYWDSKSNRFKSTHYIPRICAIKVDNLLLNLQKPELNIIKRIYSDEYKFLDLNAFRGLSSKFRSEKGSTPLIEKRDIEFGLLFPGRYFLTESIPPPKLKKIMVPKIIAQRIISYQTKPNFRFKLKLWLDYEGEIATNETVINITTKKNNSLPLSSVAAIFQSTFIEWWMRHAIYTKRFVTSKDFDRAYVNSIRVPIISGDKDVIYRTQVEKLLKLANLDKIAEISKYQTTNNLIYSLSKLFKEYQHLGENIKFEIQTIVSLNLLPRLLNLKSVDNTRMFRIAFNEILKNNSRTNFLQKFVDESNLNEEIMKIREIYYNMSKIYLSINKLVFFLYNITPEEECVILGD